MPEYTRLLREFGNASGSYAGRVSYALFYMRPGAPSVTASRQGEHLVVHAGSDDPDDRDGEQHEREREEDDCIAGSRSCSQRRLRNRTSDSRARLSDRRAEGRMLFWHVRIIALRD